MTTATKERPILFSGPMVRAILDGRKTMTRRVVKHQDSIEADEDGGFIHAHDPKCPSFCDYACEMACPYGQPGDRLWVRETWAPCIGGAEGPDNPTLYRADNLDGYDKLTWRPSIFMPRWASRITLEITDVRVERLTEITEDDAIAEGAPCIDNPDYDPEDPCDDPPQSHKAGFLNLWDKLNGARGFGVDKNPWVWVVSFRRLEGEQ